MKEAGQMMTRRPEDGHPSTGSSPKSGAPLGGRLATAGAVLAVLGLVASLLAACGGGEEEPASPPGGEDEAIASCRALEALEKYRYLVNWSLESPELTETPAAGHLTPTSGLTRDYIGYFFFDYNIDASFVAPNRIDAIISSAGGIPFRMITIGNQSWALFASDWTETLPEQSVGYRPLDICNAILADLTLSQAERKEEKVNDIESIHYSFSRIPSQQAMAMIFGPGSDTVSLVTLADVELWMAEKGNWPVRIEVSGSGLYADGRELRTHILVEIRDANSDDIQVEPPL